MTDINIADLQAMADAVDRYEDGTAMHTSGDETCVDDCAACQYEGAAGRVLPSLLDKLERYEAEPQPGDDLVEWAKNHPLYMWREVSRVEATNAHYYDALNARLANCTSCRAPNYCQPCLDILAVLNPTEAKNA